MPLAERLSAPGGSVRREAATPIARAGSSGRGYIHESLRGIRNFGSGAAIMLLAGERVVTTSETTAGAGRRVAELKKLATVRHSHRDRSKIELQALVNSFVPLVLRA